MNSAIRRVLLLLICAATSAVQADVFNMPSGQKSISFAAIGSPGNANDLATGNAYGGVVYAYSIGKYDVTAAQYAQFLNAVARTDTYSLYDATMASTFAPCGITRSNVSGSYTYGILAGHENNAVTDVSWGDAARFANWLHNGQPNGAQDASTTEDGAYALNGATTLEALLAVTKNAGAKYWIPSENEWYKSAYFDPKTNS